MISYLLIIIASFDLVTGSLLCFQEGIVLGKVCEIFGPITSPFYVVKWATLPSAISSKGNLTSKNREDSSSAKKKKNKRGSGHSKAAKKEELASITENSLEHSGENSDILEEKVIHAGRNENSDSLDHDALNQALPADADADATDAMVIIESAVVDQHICEDSEQELVQPKTITSAAQAEYFSVLMSRALPGTAGEKRSMMSSLIRPTMTYSDSVWTSPCLHNYFCSYVHVGGDTCCYLAAFSIFSQLIFILILPCPILFYSIHYLSLQCCKAHSSDHSKLFERTSKAEQGHRCEQLV